MTIGKSDKRLKRGDIVRRSIKGAKGFFYPDVDGRAIMVREDCVAAPQIGWGVYGLFSAYHVTSEAFDEKDRYDDESQKMVIWVKNG